jgi:hypothetical protein
MVAWSVSSGPVNTLEQDEISTGIVRRHAGICKRQRSRQPRNLPQPDKNIFSISQVHNLIADSWQLQCGQTRLFCSHRSIGLPADTRRL